jgi:AraC-like DNA-binding protein
MTPAIIERVAHVGSVREWARREGITRRALHRRVRRLAGTTPTALMRVSEIVRVMEQVQREGCSIAAACRAHRVDPLVFSRACLRWVGMRPSALRLMDVQAVVSERYPVPRGAA